MVTLPSYGMSLRTRRVIWPINGEMIHIFESLTPIYLFALSLLGRYDEE